MRQTGRTTRIVDFVVQQLLENGKCVATDHIAYDGFSRGSLIHFIKEVQERSQIKRLTSNKYELETEFHKIKDITIVYFKLNRKITKPKQNLIF